MGTALAVGQRITLIREVSDGPLAALFAGAHRDPRCPRLVAVKVLRHRRARDLEQLEQILLAGRRLDALGHRNVVAATDVAVVDGMPALVSRWIDGVDLLDWAEVLRETDVPVPARVVCDVVRGSANALDAASNRAVVGQSEPLGLLHRDVKPSNVLVTRDGEVKLTDFGTGITSLGGRDGRLTASKAGLGRYLSPGRRQGKRGGPASDVYALGLIGVEMLAGRWLQRVRDENPAHDRHLAEVVANLPDLGMRSPQDDRTLRSLLLRMVAFDPDARPPAAEVSQTMRTLSDRTAGPSLESFAHDHVLPYGVPELHAATTALPEALVADPAGIAALLGPAASDARSPGAPLLSEDADDEASVWVPGSLFDGDDDDELLLPYTQPPAPLRQVDTGPIDARPAAAPIAPPPTVTVVPTDVVEIGAPSPAVPLVAGAALTMAALAAGAGLALGFAAGLLLAG